TSTQRTALDCQQRRVHRRAVDGGVGGDVTGGGKRIKKKIKIKIKRRKRPKKEQTAPHAHETEARPRAAGGRARRDQLRQHVQQRARLGLAQHVGGVDEQRRVRVPVHRVDAKE